MKDKVFVEANDGIHVGSIHFTSDKIAYLSYRDQRFRDQKLDDGSAFPENIYFKEFTLNKRTRTISGYIIYKGADKDKPSSYEGEERCYFRL